jgi:hypothetical protein
MPRIIVEAQPADACHAAVTLQERVVPVQMESDWFSAQLIERVAWAVKDAADAEAHSASLAQDAG